MWSKDHRVKWQKIGETKRTPEYLKAEMSSTRMSEVWVFCTSVSNLTPLQTLSDLGWRPERSGPRRSVNLWRVGKVRVPIRNTRSLSSRDTSIRPLRRVTVGYFTNGKPLTPDYYRSVNVKTVRLFKFPFGPFLRYYKIYVINFTNKMSCHAHYMSD